MGKGPKLIIIALFLLALISIMFVFQSSASRQQILNKYKEMERVLGEKNSGLQSQLAKVEEERQRLETRLGSIQDEIGKIAGDRDNWKKNYEQIKKERDDLIEAVKSRVAAAPVVAEKPVETKPELKEQDYWAGLVQEKAGLEIKLAELDKVVKENLVKLEEIKKEKADVEMELSSLKQNHEELQRQLQYNQKLVSNISRELVREKSDRAAVIEQIEKIRQENSTLRRQVKDLSSAKLALEKGLKNLENEKDQLAGRITNTEDILQSRMRELLEIKKDIESSLGTDLSKEDKQTESVELPPIVVKAGGQAPQPGKPRDIGKVLSVNEDKNFIIVDVGENANIKIGDVFRIFRSNQHIATVEIIQTRKDVSAADIKYSRDKIAVGDLVTAP